MKISIALLRAILDGQKTHLVDHGHAFDVAEAIDRKLALDAAIDAGDERAIGRARDGVAAVEQNLQRWLEGGIEEGVGEVG